MSWSLQTLGAFRLTVEGRELAPPSLQKARALLAYLVWHRGVELPRERLVELFWPDSDPARGRSNLNTALWSIRRTLRPVEADSHTSLTANKTRIMWLADTMLDIREFESRAAGEDPEYRSSALELYHGDFLDGDYSDWSIAVREHASRLYESLLSEAVTRTADVASAQRLIDRGNLDEAPYDLVASYELAAGRRSAASAIVTRYRDALAEAGLKPSADFEVKYADLRGSAATSDRLTLPFCGRAHELALIADTAHQVVDGRGSVVVLRGDAGAGKTALLRHAERIIIDLDLRLVKVAGSFNDARPFGPWLSLYEQLAPPASSQPALDTNDATALARAIRTRLAEPACVVVDDAQYLTGDAFHVLVQLALTAPMTELLLLVATRPEGLRDLLGQITNPVRIDVTALSYEDFRDGLSRVAFKDADRLATFLSARSSGHPLFAIELLESLVSGGALRHANGTWSVTRDNLANAQLPRGVRDYIESRIYSRGDDAATIACALALEPDASAEELIAVCELGEGRTLDAIDDLLALAVVEQPESGSEFRFSHDLVRETAARCINSGRRVRLHRAFAKSFEQDARLGSHARRAEHLRASGDLFTAIASYLFAATAMLRANAWRDAMRYAATGIDLAKQLRPTKELHKMLAELHQIMVRGYEEDGQRESALKHANKRVIHARDAEDPALLSRALARRSWAVMEVGSPRDALTDLDESIKLAQDLGDEELIFYAHVHRSLAHQYQGDLDAAVADARVLLAYGCERTRNPAHRALARDRLVTLLCTLGEFEEAETVAAELAITARQAIPQYQIWAGLRIAALSYLRMRYDAAARELESVALLLDEHNRPMAIEHGLVFPLQQMVYDTLAASLARVAHVWDDAVAYGEKLIANSVASGYSRRGCAHLHLIEALLGRAAPGDVEHAEALANLLPSDNAPAGLFCMSLLRETALARISVARRLDDAPTLVRAAAEALIRFSERTPLDADIQFDALAAAAAAVSLADLSITMRKHANRIRQCRRRKVTAPCR